MPGLPPGRPTSIRPVASVPIHGLMHTLPPHEIMHKPLAVCLWMLLPTVCSPSPFCAPASLQSHRGARFLSTMAWYDESAADGEWYWSGDRRGGADPRSQLLDGNVDAASAMQSTSKVPPYWEPSLERRGYPMRTWMQDIGIWATATELQEEQIAGVVVQRIGGVARDMLREMPLELLRNGRDEVGADGVTVVHVTGLEVVIRGLSRRFGQDELDAHVQSAVELLTFRRLSGETIDNVLSRYELVRNKALATQSMQLGVGVMSWLLLTHLEIPKAAWTTLLLRTDGRLPANDGEFRALLDQIKRQAHLMERTHAGPKSLEEGWRQPAHVPQRGHAYFDFHDEADGHDHFWGEPSDDGWPGGSAAGACDEEAYFDEREDDGYPDSTTSSEYGEGLDEHELAAFAGDVTPGYDVPELFEAYQWAKRQFRAAAGMRRPRRFRRFKGKGKGSRPKGSGKGKKGGFKNPIHAQPQLRRRPIRSDLPCRRQGQERQGIQEGRRQGRPHEPHWPGRRAHEVPRVRK